MMPSIFAADRPGKPKMFQCDAMFATLMGDMPEFPSINFFSAMAI
jgi:hypothetical protein